MFILGSNKAIQINISFYHLYIHDRVEYPNSNFQKLFYVQIWLYQSFVNYLYMACLSLMRPCSFLATPAAGSRPRFTTSPTAPTTPTALDPSRARFNAPTSHDTSEFIACKSYTLYRQKKQLYSPFILDNVFLFWTQQ